jgi:hypothetical protein
MPQPFISCRRQSLLTDSLTVYSALSKIPIARSEGLHGSGLRCSKADEASSQIRGLPLFPDIETDLQLGLWRTDTNFASSSRRNSQRN